MLILLLSACGYASFYPDGTRYSADTSVPELVPCGAPALDPVTLHIVELAPVDLVLAERDVDCAEWDLGPLVDTRDIATNSGAVFVVRDLAGYLYAWTAVPAGAPDATWEIP